MGVSSAYQLHGVRIDPQTSTLDPAVRLGITAQTINTGNGIITEGSASTIYPEAINLVSRNPSAAFSTLQCKKAIDTFGSLGLCITSDHDDNHPGMRFYARQQACVGPDTGSQHMYITFAAGVCTPVGLQCDHQGNVSLSYLMSGINDNNATSGAWSQVPYIQVDQSLSSQGTFAPDDARWTMHTATFNGNTIDGKTSVELDFGTPPTIIGSDSEVEPTFAGIQQHFPTWRIRGYHIEDYFGNVDLDGTEAANGAVVFRKRKTADATAEHIQVTFSAFGHIEQVFDAQGNDTGLGDLVLTVKWDGTNNPLVWDTAYAIP